MRGAIKSGHRARRATARPCGGYGLHLAKAALLQPLSNRGCAPEPATEPDSVQAGSVLECLMAQDGRDGPKVAPRGHLGSVLGASWSVLGPYWGCLGGVLERLGASWGRLLNMEKGSQKRAIKPTEFGPHI